MKKILISTCACFLAQTAVARQAPLLEISDPSCKSLHRSQHSDECKSEFILPKETVVSWPENTTEKLLFSVLYESSYHSNDGDSWGHPGIDIVSAKWTPVVAIFDWIVTKSKLSTGYGNVIVIKHQDGEETVYSNYAHLDTRDVQEWDTVHQWQKIWEIGNTWFTIGPLGNHLDFQITTEISPSHPYAYIDCDATYMDAVQHWLCKTKLYQATHNPFDFLHAKLQAKEKKLEVIQIQEIEQVIYEAIKETESLNLVSQTAHEFHIHDHYLCEQRFMLREMPSIYLPVRYRQSSKGRKTFSSMRKNHEQVSYLSR